MPDTTLPATVYPITTATPPAVTVRTPPAAALPAHEIPRGCGIEPVILPDGTRTLAYATRPDPGVGGPTGPAPAAAQPIPAWAKTTALLAPTVGAGIGAAGVGLSYAIPGLIAMTSALWSAVALIATGSAAAIALIRTIRTRTHRPAPTHITQNIHANGLFGRANGTINHH